MMRDPRNIIKTDLFFKRCKWTLCSFFLIMIFPLIAQENPPIPIAVEVNTAQFLNFGTFTTGNAGGTVSVDYNGSRISTGDVMLLNFGPSISPALFDLTANPGTIITISHAPSIILNGSNGGTISLSLDSYSKGLNFLATANPPSQTPIYIGGTLSVGNSSASPAGQYNGSVTVTFIQQ